MTLADHFSGFWGYVIAGLTLFISVTGSCHAILYKRDSRAAVLWVGFIWLTPLVGTVLYFLFGVNRIRRGAVSMRQRVAPYESLVRSTGSECQTGACLLFPAWGHLAPLVQLGDKIGRNPLFGGNSIKPLLDGDAAYPEMLGAIDGASRSINLSTYIFDNDKAGRQFCKALGKAVERGVEVRVLIDDAGARYSWPSILRQLRRAGVRTVRFLPTFSIWRFTTMNLRMHRKLLVIDGRVAFTGGMNIRAGHVLREQPRWPIRDIHFRLEGPVVAQLQDVFADDWHFCTQQLLRGEAWFPPLADCGSVLARGISDGPDEDFEIVRLVILGALSCAKSSVRILTPYFLPDQAIISALNVAAMRGVEVDIVLPSKNNLPYIQWASSAQWWQVLERGCRIWLTPPPFDHSKLMIVDGVWVFMGSANWDPRSLRLNFELNVECYDAELARALDSLVQERISAARSVTLQEVDGRPVPIRLRDGIARLFAPFL